jgi:A/G-specific adenine glycosylase
MLQQTQVTTVLPYYDKFVRALPSISALDRAPLDKVLRLWSGLGYYRRAENMKRAARKIIRDHHGKLPAHYDSLRQLPGIGDYTAGALLSIAFQQRYPAVDGNVRRVLARLGAVSDQARLRLMAAVLVPRSRPGDFNQALMELGALVCTPKDPVCQRCPIAAHCLAVTRRVRHDKPALTQRLKFTKVIWPLAIIRRGGKVLLRRRPQTGLLASLWELPGCVCNRGNTSPEFLRQELEPLGINTRNLKAIGAIRHTITNRRILAPRYLIDCRADLAVRLPSRAWRWFTITEVGKQAISSMTAKALRSLPS